MPAESIPFVAAICGMFFIFMLVLAVTSWWSQQSDT